MVGQLASGRNNFVLAAAGCDGGHGTIVPDVLLYCSTTEQSLGAVVTHCNITKC